MKPTPDWAAARDAYWLAPSSAWESYWRGTGLSCGATGLCSMLGQPIDADDLVLLKGSRGIAMESVLEHLAVPSAPEAG